MSMQLIEQKPFGHLNVAFYTNNNTVYLNRLQLGQALNYPNPTAAIYQIHYRRRDRFDPHSLCVKQTQAADSWFYSLRGALEICRFSSRPETESVVDFLWKAVEYFSQKKSSQSNMGNLTERLTKIERTQEKIFNNTIALYKTITQSVTESPASPLSDIVSQAQEQKPSESDTYAREILSLAKKISSAAPTYKNANSVLHEKYVEMNRVYGFVVAQAKAEYRDRHPHGSGHISTVRVISEMPEFRSILINLLKDKLEEVKADQASDEPRFEIDIAKIHEVVDPVANVIKDKTVRFSYTYRLIYSVVEIDWESEYQLFEQKFGRRPTNKIEIILWKKENFHKFRDAALTIAYVHMSGMVDNEEEGE